MQNTLQQAIQTVAMSIVTDTGYDGNPQHDSAIVADIIETELLPFLNRFSTTLTNSKRRLR
jgi:hypothetical protein